MLGISFIIISIMCSLYEFGTGRGFFLLCEMKLSRHLYISWSRKVNTQPFMSQIYHYGLRLFLKETSEIICSNLFIYRLKVGPKR